MSYETAFNFFILRKAFELDHKVEFHWRQNDRCTPKYFTKLQPKITPYLKVLANLLHFNINHLLPETSKAPRKPLPLNNTMFFIRGTSHPGRRNRSIVSRSRKHFFLSTLQLQTLQQEQHITVLPEPGAEPPRWVGSAHDIEADAESVRMAPLWKTR